MKVTFEAIIADGHGEPGCSYCWPPCLRAPWTCPGEDDDDEGEPTEGTRAAPPSLTFNLAGGG